VDWLTLVLPLVKASEGCVLQAYKDTTGVWTIGYGHTGPEVHAGLTWTQAQAETQLDADLAYFGHLADLAIKVPVTPQQKAAFVDLLFNVGPGAAGVRDGIVVLKTGQPSTLLRLLNSGDYQGAAAQFLVWDRAGGIVVGGLLTRRTRENSLFLTGAWK
jgi:lysozyme